MDQSIFNQLHLQKTTPSRKAFICIFHTKIRSFRLHVHKFTGVSTKLSKPTYCTGQKIPDFDSSSRSKYVKKSPFTNCESTIKTTNYFSKSPLNKYKYTGSGLQRADFKIIGCNVKKFGYNEHSLMSNYRP